MTTSLIVRCKQWIISNRLRLAAWVFPANRGHYCANRSERSYETAAMCISFTIRDKREPDGYSWEEMLRYLDTFLGRKATPEEWRQILSWRKAQ